MSEFVKKRYVSEGKVTTRGIEVEYTATAENFRVSGPNGRYDGATSTFSYERNGVDRNGRPVLFAWNGGPGCASVYVHLGLLAPERVKCGDGPDMPQTAPFEMIPNDHCLLDVCDIVVYDAYGTGYGEIASEESKKYQASTEKDVEATISTMTQWMSAHKRWNSPLYIMGESYGTIRNAMVARNIFFGGSSAPLLHLSGIVMLGSALNHGQEDFPCPRAVMNLPSVAAANWYYHHEQNPDFGTLEQFVEECYDFANTEYLLALNAGSFLSEERMRSTAEKLHRYTNYPVEKLMENRLNYRIFDYPATGLYEEGKSIGIYDARFSLGKVKEKDYDFFSDDACDAVCMPSFSACFNAFTKEKLNITEEKEYNLMVTEFDSCWNFRSSEFPPHALEKAMHRNPKLKLMFGMGYYDMLTTLGWCRYLVSHYDYPKDRTFMKYYKAGHMPYLSDREAMKLEDDLREFILK